jgi:hypothetical protein
VLLRARCAADRARRLRQAIKDGAQSIGLVIAYLEVEARPLAEGFLIEARFSTAAPAVGAELCRYLVDGLRAEAAGDEEWDRDAPLLDLQERHRREALPLAALQLIAEARRRSLPAASLPDGQILIGQGARGWRFDPRAGAADPPWAQIGAIPTALVTGHALRAAAVERAAAQLAPRKLAVRAADGLGFDAARALLADPATEAAVIGLDTEDILRRGLPIDRCDQAVISDMSGPRPPSADDDEEWLRALGLPMLICSAPARVNLADEGLRALIPYAPHGVDHP